MKKIERTYIYLNCLGFGSTVFQTQVLDWLHLYNHNGIRFDLIQIFRIIEILKPNTVKKQLAGIRKSTRLFKGYLFKLPSRGIFTFVNAIVLYVRLFKQLRESKEVLIFSRDLLGKDVKLLRILSKCNIIFFFDARAASGEEKRYKAIKHRNFTREKYYSIANVSYLEYQTVETAKKIFVVSNFLMNYYKNTYCADSSKFVYYPCLSDENKFFFDPILRIDMRKFLGIKEDAVVVLYSGGVTNEWHISKIMFSFLNTLIKYNDNMMCLFLTRDRISENDILIQYPALGRNLLTFSVPNNEVYKYLNAADYGILFRENTIMNNVSSPTKFSEYMLCGLPVLISEGVGDYSSLTVEKEVGFLLREEDINHPEDFDFSTLFMKKFDRVKISNVGKQYFSKQVIVKKLIDHFKY